MKIEIPNISDKYLGEYTLSKEIDNSFIVDTIEGDTLYSDADHRYLCELAIFGEDKSVGTATRECGDQTFTKNIFIKHNEGSFDLRKCETTKKITFENVLDCIVNKEINIFDYPRTDTNTFDSTVTIEREGYTFNEFVQFGPGDYPLSLVLDKANILNREDEGFYIEYGEIDCVVDVLELPSGDEYGGHLISGYVTYVRVKSSIQITGDWLLIPGDTDYYYSKVEGSIFSAISSQDVWLQDQEPYITKKYRSGKANFYKNTVISNTISLNTILLDIFTCTEKTLVSNFFGINTDATAPSNKYYDWANTYSQNIKIVQSYDIIKEDAEEDSFGISGVVKVKKLLRNLFKVFKLILVTDGDDLRLEHVSYFTNKGIDITTKDYELPPLTMNKDSINTETFSFAQPTPTKGFYEVIISYELNNIYKEENDDPTKSDLFITDVFGLLNNEFFQSSAYEDLFFLISTDGDSMLSLNTALSMSEIVKELHDIHRPMKTGTIDGELVTFGGYSVGLSGEIILNSNLMNWDAIQPLMSVKTNEGTFLIDALEIDENDQLTLKIKK